jgi:1,2-diacylglycerol-3-alpha-glucose alpha-1,2-galactosyltransferase
MKRRIRLISESAFTVQGHGVHTAFVEMVAALRQRNDCEVIVNQRAKVDITHIHTIGLYSLGYLLYGSGKKVVSAHVIPESFIGSLVGARYWLPIARWYVRWFYNRADVVIAVSESTKEALLQLGVTSPIEVIHNMIDASQYTPGADSKERARKKLGIAADAWVVIGAGQVQPRKRVDSFVKTASQLSDSAFYWIGGMPFGKAAAEHGEMERMIASAPSNVHFPGVIALEDMKHYYQAADVFFLPSEQETFGLVVVEAAASGLPVMLRDIPDYDETFRQDAVMSSEKDFVSSLKTLRQDTRAYIEAKAAAGRIASRFDSKAISERIVALYLSLL